MSASRVSEWIEGFPTEPGDYWFCRLVPGYPSLSKPEQGRTFVNGNGIIHIAKDFLYASANVAPEKLWHMPLSVPEPPQMDRKCHACEGLRRPRWDCKTCCGKGEF